MKFSYEEPLPDNFLLFKTVDEKIHPFEIRLILYNKKYRKVRVEFINDNIILEGENLIN